MALSKSQLKRQRKKQKWLERRPEKRRLEREKKKERRRIQKELQKDGHAIAKPYKVKQMCESQNKFRIVIDMDFEDLMTDNELSKSCQQVARIYSANRHSENPCQLYVTSLKGKVRDKFLKTNTGCEKWDINRSELDYTELFSEELAKAKRPSDTRGLPRLVYLSGDSDETLGSVEELVDDEQRVFVIGGLVDHNRHKNLCQKRAQERGVYTAKLPIKEHVSMNQRHILSTVAVFEILLRVLGNKQGWPEALAEAIPKRKQVKAELQ